MNSIISNVKILLKLCNITSFLPHYNEKRGEFHTKPIYHSLVLAVYLLAYVYMFYVKVTLEGTLFPERGRLLIITSGILLLIGACWLLSITRSSKVYLLQDYFRIFDDFDLMLFRNFNVEIPLIKYANIITPLILTVQIIILTAGYHLWSRHTDSIQYKLHYCADAFLIVGIEIVILIKLVTLHGMGKRYGILCDIVENFTLDRDSAHKIDCLTDLHNLLSDAVMTYNDLFCWLNLGVVVYTVLVDLMSLGFFVTGYYKEDSLIFISIMLWTYLVTSAVVALAVLCEKVANEGKRCTTITYKTMSKVSDVPILRSKMLVMGSQMEARMPRFSGAGFFNIDFAMLFTFINLMVTYIIVIIQFANN